MSDWVCDHVLEGKRSFANSVIEGTAEAGKPERLEFDVCSACFGPLLYRMLAKMPADAACVMSRDADGEMKLRWELDEDGADGKSARPRTLKSCWETIEMMDVEVRGAMDDYAGAKRVMRACVDMIEGMLARRAPLSRTALHGVVETLRRGM